MIYLTWLPCTLLFRVQLHWGVFCCSCLFLCTSFIDPIFVTFFHLPTYWHSNSLDKWTAISTNAITAVCLVVERSDHPICDPHILLPTLSGTEDIKAGLLRAFLTDQVFHTKFYTDNSWIRNPSLQWEAYSKHSVFDIHCLEQSHTIHIGKKKKPKPFNTVIKDFHNKPSPLVIAQQQSFNSLFYANTFWRYCFLECK